MPSITINSNDIYYEEYGKGEPLVMIAGLGSDSTSWLPVIVPLSNKYRLIVFDNRGVGRSSSDNSSITIGDMSNDASMLIEHLGLKPVNILSHSMGGMIAMEMAARRPDLVNKLILTATAPVVSQRNKMLFTDMASYLDTDMDRKLWFRNLFYWIFSSSFFEDEEFVNQAVNMALNYRYPQSDESFRNQVEAIIKYDGQKNVDKIKSPTLLICGDEDLLFPAKESENLFGSIPQLTSLIISGAAHSIHMDKPEEFVNRVSKFLG